MAAADFDMWVRAARSTPLAEIAARRSLRLRGTGCERVGGCPGCGDGGKGDSDRFSINTAKNVFLCRQCGQRGDPIAFAMWCDGSDFLTACATLTGMPAPGAGAREVDLSELARREAERRDKAAKAEAERDLWRQREREKLYGWWRQARQAAGSPLEEYLRLRCLTLPASCKALRFTRYGRVFGERDTHDDGGRRPVLHIGPAMYAAIQAADGRFCGLHTTWIDLAAPDGKLRLPDPVTGELVPARKVRGTQRGSTIRLAGPDEPAHLVIGEGIETTLSRHDDMREDGEDLSDVAFWAAVSLGNLGGAHDGTVAHPTLKDRGGKPVRVPGPVPAEGRGKAVHVPDSVTRLTLLGDGDSDPVVTGHALERARRRYARPGRLVEVVMAPPGLDFNDVRRRRP
jgi:hypothetical protein